MIVRVLIAVFASSVGGVSYLAGQTRLMTALLLGFGAFVSVGLGVVLMLPEGEEYLWFPLFGEIAFWPYLVIGLILAGMIPVLFLVKPQFEMVQNVSAAHLKALLAGLGGYAATFFIASFFWFPSDARRAGSDDSTLSMLMLVGTLFFIAALTVSLYFFYKASQGSSEQHPDLMKRFVLGLFAFLQLDKLPLLVAYLLLYAPEIQTLAPNLPALALSAYIPVGIFLLKTTWETIET